ncbi:recombinase family protein [Alkaliphilus metalliredigens]|uniref:recombinase family protein n=1 Tax=Alkaliphilus metalliredigens TaxID=208226 RepID=UPI0038CC0B02
MILLEKAALYIRVSTHHQIDKDSLPFQKKELINYSKYVLGVDEYEIFEDAGYSGKNTDRPKFQEMMSRIRAGEFTHVLVWKIDRVSRNLRDFTEMYDEIKKYNVTFISKNEQFDTSTAMGEAMLKIILVFAELERKLTAERVYSIMLSRAEKGLWNGAPVPLGYDFDEELKFAVVNEEEAKIVKFIFDTYEEVKSTGEVKHRLEANGIRTKRNGHWTTKTISDVIRNPFYVGTYRYNYRYSPHGKIRPEEEWVVVEDNHPAIVSKEQYEKLNKIMDSNAHGRGTDRTKENHIHVFKGLISCSKCNKNYIASTDRPRSDGYRPSVYRCYNYVHNKKQYRTCSGGIGEVKLGPFVINYIANLIKSNEFISTYGSKGTEKEVEKILLKGSSFKGVAGIIAQDLKHTYEVLLKNTGDILFDSIEEPKDIEQDMELESLKSEKKKIERALQRLEDLYLFSEDSMSEKNYLVKKQELEKRINSINDKIKKRSQEYSRNLPGHDLSFIKKATQYLLAHNLYNDRAINYNKIVKMIDKKLLQDFMQCVVKKITVDEDKTISSIEFVNGLSHRFIYRK